MTRHPRSPAPGSPPLPTRRRLGLGLCILILALAPPAAGQARQATATRQVTLFGILASPGGRELDPKLEDIAPQLRRLFPNHGFELLGVETKRIASGETITTKLGDGLNADARLLNPRDGNGKAQLRFQLDQAGRIDFATLVNTPLGQLFFLDKRLSDGSRLIIGIGVRE